MTTERTTRYTRCAGVDGIAYQVVGDGPFDVVFVPGFISNGELSRTEPGIARFYDRLASFSRLILFGKRESVMAAVLAATHPAGRGWSPIVRGQAGKTINRWGDGSTIRKLGLLSRISVPTLVLHRTNEVLPIEAARDVAARISGARLAELHAHAGRVLVTVLVTDIVGTTQQAAALGDTAWRSLLTCHDELLRRQLHRFSGQEAR